MNQDSAHSEQDSPAADTAETNQAPKDDQASNDQESNANKMTPILLKIPKLN